MPDSHNAKCESRLAARIPLDGGQPGIARRHRRFFGRMSCKILGEPEPYRDLGIPIQGRRVVSRCDIKPRSNHEEIDQGDQGGTHAGYDQGVVGREVGFLIERWWVRFLGHSGQLRQAAGGLCEADHICRILFAAWWIRNGRTAFGLVIAGSRTGDGSATPDVAIGERPTKVAVDADRRHGGSFASGSTCRALRQARVGGVSRPARPSGVG